jgi:uncharacterized protein YbbK (DUF523 family)
MIHVLVSSCLLGQPVRYNATDAPCDKTILSQWQNEGRLVHFCPELSAGFPIPRPPAETVGGDGKLVLNGQAKVIEDTGKDVTEQFVDGAYKTLDFAEQMNVKLAIMPEGSPSCGPTFVYDGNFTGTKVPGKGVTVELLEQNGICIFSENQIEDALAFLQSLEEFEEENPI